MSELLVLLCRFTFIPVYFLSSVALADNAEQVFSRTSGSIVVVENATLQGSGVAIGYVESLVKNRYLLVATNCHVVVKADSDIALIRGGQHIGLSTLVYEDREKDLCILAAQTLRIPIVKMRDANDLRMGEQVFSVGAPRGLELSIASGLVSQLRGERMVAPMIQTTASISPGSSGGGLFDSRGLLVGLTTMYLADSQGLNFAIPSEWVRDGMDLARAGISSSSSIQRIVVAPKTKAQERQCKTVLVDSTEAIDTYFDECSTSKVSRFIVSWTVLDIKMDPKTGRLVGQSVRSKDAYDCAAGRTANLAIAMYSGPLGSGTIVSSISVPETEWKFEDTLPRSPAARLLAKVCGAK